MSPWNNIPEREGPSLQIGLSKIFPAFPLISFEVRNLPFSTLAFWCRIDVYGSYVDFSSVSWPDFNLSKKSFIQT